MHSTSRSAECGYLLLTQPSLLAIARHSAAVPVFVPCVCSPRFPRPTEWVNSLRAKTMYIYIYINIWTAICVLFIAHFCHLWKRRLRPIGQQCRHCSKNRKCTRQCIRELTCKFLDFFAAVTSASLFSARDMTRACGNARVMSRELRVHARVIPMTMSRSMHPN